MDGTVLVADDDRTIRTVLTQALTRAGCKVHATASLTTLMRWIGEGKGDLVISDVIMPEGNGLEMLPRIAEERPGLPVIVISAQNTITTAIQAAEAEAWDYLPKPFDLPDLMKRVSKALSRKRVAAPQPEAAPQAHDDHLPLVGRTAAMQELYRLVARVMNTDIPVLVSGESGTGKSLIARAIHDFSDRRDQPFLVAHMAELEDPSGARTLMARAAGGTLLLDEIADCDAQTQARLARMESGEFRQDLYYRVAGVTVSVPSLRARIDDIPLLAEHFLARAARDGATPRVLSEEALDLVRSYSWPGNVRQLENVVRRLAATGTEPQIAAAELQAALGNQPAAEPLRDAGDGEKLAASVARHLRRYFDLHGGTLPPPGLYQRIMREVEAPLLEIALEATSGNQARCAELLGINRNTLRKKVTDLDIRVTRRRKLM